MENKKDEYYYSIEPKIIKDFLNKIIENGPVDEILSITTYYGKEEKRVYEIQCLIDGGFFAVTINVNEVKNKEELK